MKYIATTFILLILSIRGYSQVFWNETFDGLSSNWVTENAAGSKTNPTPAGIVGLSYVSNQAGNNYFRIGDANTPELDPNTGSVVRGRSWNCNAPNNLPNPYPGGGVTNKSLYITAKANSDGAVLGTVSSPDYGNEYSYTNMGVGEDSNSDQFAYLNADINTEGRCNMTLTAQFFLGGDMARTRSYSSILYSIDGGTTWKVLQDNLGPSLWFLAGTCNAWETLSFNLPPECENIPNLRIGFRWRNDNSDPLTTADYTLNASFNVDNIQISTPAPPTVDFTATNVNPCKFETVTIYDATNQNGISGAVYNWSISPNTFEFVDNTNASTASPKVRFLANGSYTVSLTVTTCIGTIIQTKTNFINVNNCLPQPDFTANRTQTCVPNPAPVVPGSPTSVTLTAQNFNPYIPCTGGCVAYTWSFAPSNGVSYLSGNANSGVIEVQFANAGTYAVTLTAQNDDGTNSITKSAFISVIDCQCTVSSGGSSSVEELYYQGFNSTLAASSWVNTNLTSPWGNSSFFGISNIWQVSAAESGMPENTCGAANMGNGSLYMGASAIASGAAYLADVNTNRRIASPAINTVGKTNIVLEFKFIGNGEADTDKAYLQYSIDNGVNWINATGQPTTTNPALGTGGSLNNLKSQICSGGQGRWTKVTWEMPTTCENIAGLRIAFVWQSNNNAVSTDPSFAVDDIYVRGTGSGGGPVNTWTGATSNAWNVATNWTSGVPIATSSVVIPQAVPNMPVITTPVTVSTIWIQDKALLTVGTSGSFSSQGITNDGDFILSGGNANSTNVCNNGVINITGNAAPNNYQLTVYGFLNNNGAIVTTSLDSLPDVVLNKNTIDASVYRGVGTNIGVDYLILNSGGTDFTKLEANLSCRSIRIEGDFNMSNRTLTLKKSFVHQAGSINFLNSTVVLDGSAQNIQDGNGLQVLRHNNGSTPLAFFNLNIVKSQGPVIVQSNFQVSNNLRMETNSFVEVQPTALLWLTNSAPTGLTQINGHIVGKFRRNITGTGNYEYPLGNKPNYQGAFLNILSPMGSVNFVTGEFVNVPNIIGNNISLMDIDGITYTQGVIGPGYWNLTPNAFPASGSYELTVKCGPDFTPPGSIAPVTLAKRSDSTSSWELQANPVSISWPLVRRTGFDSFSDFYPVTNMVPMPVESSPLQAQVIGTQSIQVSWTTFVETNNVGYVLERSTDAQTFEPISILPTQGASRYQYTDTKVKPGVTYYYRYIQQDIDGASTTSNVASARINVPQGANAPQLLLYPNPVKESLNFTVNVHNATESPFTLTIFDASGKTVFSDKLAENGIWQRANLVNGIYYYRLQNQHHYFSGKIVLE